jgi:hypothetical protein
MRGNLVNLFGGEEPAYLARIFSHMLRTPALHPLMDVWYKVSLGEPLAMLYDIFDECRKNQQMARQYLESMIQQFNIYVGDDVSQELTDVDLLYNDLTELCEAVDLWLMSGRLNNDQVGLAQSVSGYYRDNGGINPGALNVIRGWYEMLQVVMGEKLIIRCIAPDCNKLVVITPDKDLLSGTIDGYHNQTCQLAHTEGAENQDLTLQQLPGSQQLSDTVGGITQGQPNGTVNQTETPTG